MTGVYGSTNNASYRLKYVMVCGLSLVFLLWLLIGASGVTESGDSELSKAVMKTKTFLELDIPKEVEDAINRVQIITKSVDVLNVKVFYIEAESPSTATNQDILLLHGAAFSSKTWLDLKTVNYASAMGHKVIAVDLPGKGQTPSASVNSEEFLQQLIATLNLQKPVIVAPSMSGGYALPLFKSHPELFGGFIPVAPVGVNAITEDQLKTIEVPTLIVYGEKDSGGARTSEKLSSLPNSLVVELPNAQHPAYLDQPDMWHKLIYNFMKYLQ